MGVDYKLIGSRIKKIRKEKHQTQEHLAETLDVTVGYISQIERGITKVNLDTLSEIGNALETDLCYFISGTIVNNQSYFQDELNGKYAQLSEGKKKLLIDFIDILSKSDI